MHLLSPETRITFYGVSYSANHFTNGYFQDWVDRHYLKLMIKLIENHLWCRAQYVQFVILMDVLSTLLNVLNTIPLLEHHSPTWTSFPWTPIKIFFKTAIFVTSDCSICDSARDDDFSTVKKSSPLLAEIVADDRRKQWPVYFSAFWHMADTKYHFWLFLYSLN